MGHMLPGGREVLRKVRTGCKVLCYFIQWGSVVYLSCTTALRQPNSRPRATKPRDPATPKGGKGGEKPRSTGRNRRGPAKRRRGATGRRKRQRGDTRYHEPGNMGATSHTRILPSAGQNRAKTGGGRRDAEGLQ